MKTKMDIEQLLEQGEVLEIHPKGYSMYPLIVPGRDTAVIRKQNSKEIRRGAVLLYRRSEGILVLHRVVKRQDQHIYMVGDNQVEVEGPLNINQVKGIMTAVNRNGKMILANNIGYRILTRLWLWLRPIRFYITKPLAKIKKIMRHK